MFRQFVLRGVLVLLLLALVAGGVGWLAYNAGVARGLADSGKVALPAAGVVPYPYLGGPFFFGWGLGPFNCLLFFFGLGLIFLLVRSLVWGGPFWRRPFGHHAWGGPGTPWGAHRAWEKGYPPIFEEWHRRMHGQGEPSAPPPESGRA